MHKVVIVTLLAWMSTLVCLGSPTRANVGGAHSAIVRISDRELPDGVIRVEYLEAFGSQYIDTGIVPTVETDIYCGFMGLSSAWNLYIFGLFRGSVYSTGSMSVATDPSYFSILFPTSATSGTYRRVVPFKTGFLYDIHYCKDFFDANGSVDSGFTWNNNFAPERSMFVLAVNAGAASNFQIGRLYYFKMTELGNVLIDLVPIRFEDEGGRVVGAMYDYVSNRLFLNSGTGSFAIGPDVE